MEFKVGDEVAFNTLADAVWFEVVAIDGFVITIKEVGLVNAAEQTADKSMVKQVRAK